MKNSTAPNRFGSLIRSHALAIAELAAKSPTAGIVETIDHHTRSIARLSAQADDAVRAHAIASMQAPATPRDENGDVTGYAAYMGA